MNRHQTEYIKNKLKDKRIEEVTEKYTTKHVSTPLMKDILYRKYTSGEGMSAVLSLFDNTLRLSNVKRDGLYYLSTSVEKWVNKMDLLKVSSSESKVYDSCIGDIKVIIKCSKNLDYEDLIREYFIGVTQINKLRYQVPNFMYTLGEFWYDKTLFVIYEKIPGITLEEAFRTEKLSFEQFLSIFFQVLVALEIAQEEIRFCHFDLHVGNIVLRPIKNSFKYTVVIGSKRYDIVARDYIPVIIDFGMSSVCDGVRTIGSYHFSCYGMMNYLVPGVDMYKLLFYSSLYSKNFLHRNIVDLFRFYGREDPYKILIQKPGYLNKISKEFVKSVTFSKSGNIIPLEFINWLISQSDYNRIISRFVKISDRDIFMPLNQSLQVPYDIFSSSNKMLLELLNPKTTSYIIFEHTKRLLKLQPKYLKIIDKLDKKIRMNKFSILERDRVMLMEYKKIKVYQYHEKYNKILKLRLGKNSKTLKRTILQFLNSIKPYQQTIPYLQFMYTIKELGLDKKYEVYKQFITSFTESLQYKFYIDFHDVIRKIKRWSITLLEEDNIC